MCGRRVGPAKHLFVGVAILSVFALGAASEANAQIDPNLQSRIITLSPPITVLTPEVNSETNSVAVEAGRQLRTDAPCLPDDWYEKNHLRFGNPKRADPKLADRAVQALNTVRKAAGKKELTREHFIKLSEGGVDVKKILRETEQQPGFAEDKNIQKVHEEALQQVGIQFTCGKPQVPGMKVSFPFNPTYETNALKSDANAHPDWSLGFGGGILVTGPGLDGRPYDVVAFNAQSASARYSAFPSKSLDTLTEQGIYQIYLGAYHPDWSPIDAKSGQITNLLTIDTLALGFVNQTAYLPGYRVETADLFTPQFTLARQNIPLSRDVCQTLPAPSPTPAKSPAPGAPPSPAPPDPRGSCYYVDLALTVGQTFSDVTTQQNTNVAVSATPGLRIDNSNWKVTLPMVATAREYDNVLGGRQDVLLQVGPAATFTLPTAKGAPSLMLSLAATYNRNYSTLSTAAWRGYIIQPTLTAAF
jgi:hypothetical protein